MAHQPNPLKILAIGSPLSAIDVLVSKITSINAKAGPFDACVIVGDLFKDGSDGSELGDSQFPVPTYFTVGKNNLPDAVQERIAAGEAEIVPNLVYLGKTGVLTTAQGLKIAYVGGGYSTEAYDATQELVSPAITANDISTLLTNPLITPPTDAAPSLASARDGAVALPSPFQGVDLLIGTPPPPSLALLSPSFPSSGLSLASPAPPLADVIKKARPRYVFWSEGEGFWEREPLGWAGPGGSEERWTRAVKLGALGGEASQTQKKARWFYAFTLPAQTPSTPIPARPANTTPNPFIIADPAGTSERKRAPLEDQQEAFNGEPPSKRSRADGDAPPEGYVCKACGVPGHFIRDCPTKQDRDHSKPPPGYVCKICGSSDHYIRECPQKDTTEKPVNAQGKPLPPPTYLCRACGKTGDHYARDCDVVIERQQGRQKQLGPAECWFCLSNPKVTKHLIVAIGSETYVTLPKGQIIPTTPAHIAKGGSGPLVPGGGHVLIIPIAHHPTLLSIPAEDATAITTEIDSYKSALKACYASYGAVPVTFEVGRLSNRGGHAHVQVVPVPNELADKVATAFRIAGEKSGLVWEPDGAEVLKRIGPAGNYFKVECPDGTTLVHLLRGNFDLQFGRMVIAGLLGLHHRVDWKECGQTEEEDRQDAQAFKKAFAPFHS